MPKDEEFMDVQSSSPAGRVANDLITSPSAKYRLVSSDNVAVSPLSASSPTSRRSTPNVSSIHTLMKRTSALRMTGTSSTTPESPSKPPSPSSPKGKLPNKLRQHVSRLRKQFAMTTGGTSSLASLNSKGSKTRILASSPLSSLRRQTTKSRGNPFQAEYSRQSIRMLPASENQQPAPNGDLQNDFEADNLAEDEENFSLSFLDLLKPLQNSLSCASLMSEWASDEDEKEDLDELLFRESERNFSRMLRICCSVDNLMLSIGGQVHEQKHDEALARGAARELMHLFRFAIHQATAIFTSECDVDSRDPSHQKEEQYAREFLAELTNRVVLLDRFNRSTFVKEVNSLQLQVTELQTGNTSLKEANEQLQLEIAELRDFNTQNNALSLDFSGKSDSDKSDSKTLHRVSTAEHQEITSLLESSPATDDNASTSNELEFFKDQCKEYARLLEIAKEEIRLCHHDREVQNQRISELSNAIFKDHEVVLLRNQLQSEKRRVKNLEMENLSLLETQVDQSHKIQSLLLNGGQLGSSSKTSDSASNMGKISSSVQDEAKRDHKSSTDESMYRSISQNMANNDETEMQNALSIRIINEETPIADFENAGTSIQQGRDSTEKIQLKNKASEPVWIYRLIGYSPKEGSQQGSDPLHEIATRKQFLSSLLMSASQLAAAHVQAKIRKQANVPSISPPATFLSSQSTKEKTRKNENSSSAKQKNNSPGSNDNEVLALCRQLIWFFYQRFLMAEEAEVLLTGYRQRTSKRKPNSLAFVVVHFFLERKSRDEDGFADIMQFVKCLHAVRYEAGDVRFFCDFLEGKRDRSELCYLLWVLQIIDAVKLGISYDGPLVPSSADSSFSAVTSSNTPFICTLKATFVSRLIFRLLHFKSAPHDKAAKSPTRMKSKSIPRSVPTTPSPSSPKAKHKRRGPDAGNRVQESFLPGMKLTDASKHALLEYARNAFQFEIHHNSGNPLTLEIFNSILLRFAQETPADELIARLGSFYRPTGDEQKLPLEVFLVLLLEMFQHQNEWRKQEMQQLFIALHRKQEAQELAALEMAKERAASSSKRSRNKIESPVVAKMKKKKGKTSKKKKKVSSTPALTAKYLKGLSRKILREFLVQSRIVPNVHQVDIDELYANILELSTQSAEDIHFDHIYNALKDLGWLDARHFQVETAAMQIKYDESDSRKNEFGRRLQEIWRVQAAQSIALCENDPNIFVRKYCQSMMRAIDERFTALYLVSTTEQSEYDIWEILRDIRDLLGNSWRLAAKRARDLQLYGDVDQSNRAAHDTEFCFTELYFINQALRIVSSNCDVNYELVIERNQNVPQLGSARDLNVFNCIENLRLDDMLASENPSHGTTDADNIKSKLRRILQRYSAHLSHLFNSFSSGRWNFCGLTSSQWQAMVVELHLINHKLPTSKAQELYLAVFNGMQQSNHLDDVFLSKTQFVELLIRFARERHHAMYPSQSKMDLAKIMTSFCQEVIAPNAFNHRHRLQEEDFRKRMSCPLVGCVLLEHRAFIRIVFLVYAKNLDQLESISMNQQASNEGTGLISVSNDCVVSTKRSYMALNEFQLFLQDFQLYSHDHNRQTIDSEGGDYIFRSVMSLENDDVSRMEFDEFTAAVAAIAAYVNPSPFVLWHVKIDALVAKLAKRWEMLRNTSNCSSGRRMDSIEPDCAGRQWSSC